MIFNLHQFVYAGFMSAACKFGIQEGFHNSQCHIFFQNSCAHRHDLCVVVFSAHLCGKFIMAQCGTDALHLVCRNGNADTGTANDDALIAFTVYDCLSNCFPIDGIVAAFFGVGAVILIFQALFFQPGRKFRIIICQLALSGFGTVGDKGGIGVSLPSVR